jgi:hypothetical protein
MMFMQPLQSQAESKVQVFTRDDLRRALVMKGVLLKDYTNAEAVAAAITAHGLSEVVAGKHDGRAVKYAMAFELVFGERLK